MPGLRRPAGICILCSHPRSPKTHSRISNTVRGYARTVGNDREASRNSRDEKPNIVRFFETTKGTRPRYGETGGRPRDVGRSKDFGRRSGPPRDWIKKKYGDVLIERAIVLRKELSRAPIAEQLTESGSSFGAMWGAFAKRILVTETYASMSEEDKKTYRGLRDAYNHKGENGLDDRIKYAFYGFVTGVRFTESDIRNQQALADLRYPTEWFPATRTMHRTIHLHVGPTNSGKTYHALKRLEAAESGVYAGPLRLLAHEVYTRLNAKGRRCTLVTGEERRTPDDSMASDMSSCTVEMMPMNKTVEVAVIDEIQMIGNSERGWAWTQALLGVKAKEVHLCGEVRTVPLIREICASIGEKLEVHTYERLSPLKMAEGSMEGDLRRLRKGDCIVSFSVVGIHALRKEIEKQTKRKVATVYGSLPPETRAQQARLFNDPDNEYDFLVASDAIGMGLNLSIKRIIFESAIKFDGFQQRPLAVADIKQIAGRAGRYRTAQQAIDTPQAREDLNAAKGEPNPEEEVTVNADDVPNGTTVTEGLQPMSSFNDGAVPPPEMEENPQKEVVKTRAQLLQENAGNVGLVTTLENIDFQMVEQAMRSEPEPILTAGIFPPAPIVERFAQYFPPGTPFSFILLRLHELSQMHSRYHLCGLKDQLYIADIIEPVRNLTITDRIILCACPASKQDVDLFRHLLPALARCIEQQGGGHLLDILEMPIEVLEQELSASRFYLRELERLHKGIIVYLWLSYRFAGIFPSRVLAFHVKSLVESKIEQVLSGFNYTEKQREKIKTRREHEVMQALRNDKDEDMDGDTKDPFERTRLVPDEQTSVIAGGDNFAGESEEIIEPIDEEEMDVLGMQRQDLPPRTATNQHDTDMNQATEQHTFQVDEYADEYVDGSRTREDASLSPTEPEAGTTPGITPEVDEDEAPLKTQLTTPASHEETSADFVQDKPSAGSDVPTKHLHNAHIDSTELERDIPSRP